MIKDKLTTFASAMRKHIHSARDLVLPLVDFFYPLFKRLMPLQTFRYAACGGINTLLGFAVYFISFKYILNEENLHFRFYAFKSHVAALFISFLFSFPFGFFLMKYVVFSDSKMKGKIQLFRYFMIYLFNLVLNYLLLKVFVEIWHIYPIAAQIITTIIIIIFSYLAQRHFTFKIKNAEEDITG
jgi:putative flippase GtrA